MYGLSLFNNYSILDDLLSFNKLDSFFESKREITGWEEHAENYTYVINGENPEITDDGKCLTVKTKYTKDGYNRSSEVMLSYPKNSIPDTITAKKEGDTVVVTLEKKEKDKKGRKIEIQ